MKAFILNSGLGKRMGDLTRKHPKCMTELVDNETILSRQLKQLQICGINDVVMTTGLYDKVLIEYCNTLNLQMKITFVNNPIYDKTNYIYSVYLAKEHIYDNDVIFMHGDLVFEMDVLKDMIQNNYSCMAISSLFPLPTKDFKAVINNRNLIEKIGIDFFDNAVAAQPLYKIQKQDWNIWLNQIAFYCENGQVSCYAENAFNEISNKCHIYPMDYKEQLCAEIDTPEDLMIIRDRLDYICN